jgi:peroxiredoxin
LGGEASSTRTLPGSSILILFNTDCDHCQREAKEISEKIDAFKNYELLFIASDSIHQIENFGKTYHIADKPNIKFGRAEGQDVYMNFGAISTPAIYIYNRERKFVKSFLGETPVEELIKYL